MRISANTLLLSLCIGFIPQLLSAQENIKPYFFVRPVHQAIQQKEITVGEKPKTIPAKNSFYYLLFLETKCKTKPVISSVTINGKSFKASVKKIPCPYSIPDMPEEKKLVAKGSNSLYQVTELEIIDGNATHPVTHRIIIKVKLQKKSFTISDDAKLLPAMAAQ